MGKFFGTDGIRGKAEKFSAEFVDKIIEGLGAEDKKVLIGGDTRESTEQILSYLEKSLARWGAREIINVGVLPTPAINYVFFELGCDLAVDVTASHNPYTDNGIKIFERGETSGVKLGEAGRERIERVLSGEETMEKPDSLPEVLRRGGEEARELYRKHLREYLGEATFEGRRVGLDLANGATAAIKGAVFEQLGADVAVINDDAQFGRKINDGVGSTHIEGLQKLVVERKLNLGAAFDGDGDRCMLVDENGEEVDGDQMMAIIAKHLGLNKIVGTIMSNQGLLNWGEKAGVEVLTSDVGDQNVAKMMRETGAKLGGEQSGHVILPGEAMGDGMLTALMVLKIMSEEKKTLSELAREMEKMPQVMTNIHAAPEDKARLKTDEEIKKIVSDYERKLGEKHGRLLVRPSGTEELVRITLWGENQTEIDSLAEELAEKLTKEFNHGRN